MVDFTSQLGRQASRRLRHEKILWLTTVDAHQRPQPRPVWFQWDGHTVLIFSERNTAKLRHISRNPAVSLNFNTDEDGDNVCVLIGEAKISAAPPPTPRVRAYVRKYKQGMKDLGMTLEQFSAAFAVPILVAPQSVRGS